MQPSVTSSLNIGHSHMSVQLTLLVVTYVPAKDKLVVCCGGFLLFFVVTDSCFGWTECLCVLGVREEARGGSIQNQNQMRENI